MFFKKDLSALSTKLISLRVGHWGLPTMDFAFKFISSGYVIISLFCVSSVFLCKTNWRIFWDP